MAERSRLLDLGRRGGRLDGVFVFDAHQHIGTWHPFHIPAPTVDDAVRVMDRVGIDAACTSAIAAVLGSDVRRGNDEVVAATKEYPGRIFGYIRVSPTDPAVGTADEVERCAREGLRAIKIHNYQGVPYDAEAYRPAYEIADERGWPVLAHTWEGDMTVLDRLAGEYPNVKWLLAHAGTSGPEAYCELARRHDNVFLEICSSGCAFNLVERLVKGAGAEKVLFGTDMTFLAATQQIGKVLFARIPDDAKERILGENARTVFDLP